MIIFYFNFIKLFYVPNVALVFLIKGVFKDYKQPIAFYYSEGPFKTDTMVSEVIQWFDEKHNMLEIIIITKIFFDIGSKSR